MAPDTDRPVHRFEIIANRKTSGTGNMIVTIADADTGATLANWQIPANQFGIVDQSGAFRAVNVVIPGGPFTATRYNVTIRAASGEYEVTQQDFGKWIRGMVGPRLSGSDFRDWPFNRTEFRASTNGGSTYTRLPDNIAFPMALEHDWT